jgi:hypothetical protein
VISADVFVQELDGPPVAPDLADKIAVHVDDETKWVLVENGTTDGHPSVLLAIPLGEYDAGKYAVLELSYALFETIGATFRGAVLKWHDEGRL